MAGLYFAVFSPVSQFLPALLKGLTVTVSVAVPSILFTYVISIAAGLGRLSTVLPLRWLSAVYIEVFRGVSLLVILFWLYFVLPEFGLTLSAYTAAFLGISLNAGAYGAEIVRGAVQAVPRGQFEACVTLNLTLWHKYGRIILPQALVIAVPAMTNMTIELLKGTALVSAVTLVDLTAAGVRQNQLTYQTVEIFSALALVYFCLAQVIRVSGTQLEQVFNRHLGAQ
ncbi:MAG: ectoine/hydroxyectoine ABC transporter permease subunit EhuC [Gammaproteobacteria bacterium]|nr:ectoine/hydroxyectoine ABC transporter permease subunit EhuC [Gammaproteobacteria bacterium]